MKTPSRFEMWYGRDEPPAATQMVRAGTVTALLVGADLRYVRFGDVELVRRLYVALRDRTWQTPSPEYSDVTIDAADDHFSVGYTARVRRNEIDFTWTGSIVGGADGSITYAIDGVAATEFLYNRIGFCVLHPVRECTGRPYRARTPSGPIEGTLPVLIGPQRIVDGTEAPLFPSIDRLEIDLEAGARVRFDFEGDLFDLRRRLFSGLSIAAVLSLPIAGVLGFAWLIARARSLSARAVAANLLVVLSIASLVGIDLTQIGADYSTRYRYTYDYADYYWSVRTAQASGRTAYILAIKDALYESQLAGEEIYGYLCGTCAGRLLDAVHTRKIDAIIWTTKEEARSPTVAGDAGVRATLAACYDRQTRGEFILYLLKPNRTCR